MSAIADQFAALHRSDPPLLLPNPGDVGSARLFESLGFAREAAFGPPSD